MTRIDCHRPAGPIRGVRTVGPLPDAGSDGPSPAGVTAKATAPNKPNSARFWVKTRIEWKNKGKQTQSARAGVSGAVPCHHSC